MKPGQFDPEIAAITQAKADEPPPDTDDHVTLAEFYLERGIMAREIGRPKQALTDVRTALKYAEDETGRKVAGMSNKLYSKILTHVGHLEIALGNLSRGLALLKRSLEIRKRGSTYQNLAGLYFKVGDYKSGEEYTKKGIRYCNKLIREGYKRGPVIGRDRLWHRLLEARGQFAEAEPYIRSQLKNMEKYGTMYDRPKNYIYGRSRLAQNLAKQGRLI